MKLWTFIFCFLLISFTNSLFAEKPPSYTEAAKILEEKWKETYPVAFTKILKKDTIGKGIMVLSSKKGKYYLYTFLISFPKYSVEEGKLRVEKEDFKNIIVKFYYEPFEIEEKYRIDLGEFTEKYNQKSARWIK